MKIKVRDTGIICNGRGDFKMTGKPPTIEHMRSMAEWMSDNKIIPMEYYIMRHNDDTYFIPVPVKQAEAAKKLLTTPIFKAVEVVKE